jgi:leucyl/phenylalanyl-tRNA--protein transferase
MQNPHLERFGAYEIADGEYGRLLEIALSRHCRFL